MQKLHRAGVTVTPMTRVSRLRREGNKIAVTLWSPYTEADCGERIVDQVVLEQATLPLDALYFALKADSVNRGEVDYEALVEGRPQTVSANPQGRFRLYRIGDAVAARNVHAAIYDALRLCKDF
jgi:hypothetical protein